MSVSSYSKIFAIGHPAVVELFRGTVRVEEKIDGSQFSFMRDQGAWAKKEILGKATRGMPEWYKRQLLESVFPGGDK